MIRHPYDSEYGSLEFAFVEAYSQRREYHYNRLKNSDTEVLERRLSKTEPKGILDFVRLCYLNINQLSEHAAILQILNERRSTSASIDNKL